jgi:ubiquinone/menaquinone biosynthesis C-methylase UbiE
MVNESILLNDNFVKNGQAHFVTGDALSLPFENDFFDKIFTVNTIYFWQDKSAVLEDISRTLKKNGRLIIALRPEWVMKSLPVAKYGFEFFTGESVAQLLASHGFSVSNIIEKDDEDVKLDELTLPNAFVIVNAIKL